MLQTCWKSGINLVILCLKWPPDMKIHKNDWKAQLMVCQHFSLYFHQDGTMDLPSLMDVSSRWSFSQESAKPDGISKNMSENKASQGSGGRCWVADEVRWRVSGLNSAPEMRQWVELWFALRKCSIYQVSAGCVRARSAINKDECACLWGIFNWMGSKVEWISDLFVQINTQNDCWAMCTHFHPVQRG